MRVRNPVLALAPFANSYSVSIWARARASDDQVNTFSAGPTFALGRPWQPPAIAESLSHSRRALRPLAGQFDSL